MQDQESVEQKRAEPRTDPLRLSIVLPVLNEERYLDQTLEALANQSVPSNVYEVLIYDGGSQDATREIAGRWSSRFTHFTLRDNPRRLPSSARNLGVAAARGDVIAFLEGHCVVPSSFVERALALLHEHEAQALGRPIDLLVPNDPPVQQAIGIARQSPLGHARGSLLYSDYEGFTSPVSCATIYRREVFDQLGPFDEGLYVAEDVEFNQRFEQAGLRHYFSHELGCHYHPRRTFRAFFRQMYNYGLGRTRSCLRRGSVSLSDFSPLVLAGGLLGLVVAAVAVDWRFSWPVIAYVVAVACYAVFVAFRHGKVILSPLVFIATLITHFGLGAGQVGGLIESVFHGQRSPERND